MIELVTVLLTIIGFFALIPVLVYINGWVTSHVWNMFMPVIFGLPHLSVIQGVALAIVVGLFKNPRPHQEDRTTKEKAMDIGIAIGSPLITLLMAHIVKSYM